MYIGFMFKIGDRETNYAFIQPVTLIYVSDTAWSI